MGKAKKGKKDSTVEEVDVDNKISRVQEDGSNSENETVPKPKKIGKEKNAKKLAIESDSESEEIAKPAKKTQSKTEKAGKGKKKKKADSDESDVDQEQKAPKKSGFDLLMADESDDDGHVANNANESEQEEEEVQTKTTNKKKQSVDAGNKKGKKARKGRRDSDEDIDQMLAELAIEYSGGKKAELTENKADKKEIGKKGQPSKEDDDALDDKEDLDDEGGALKTAAQKKKEKKERQKREAALLKQQQANQPPSSTEPDSTAIEQEKKASKSEKAKKKEVEVAPAEETTADGEETTGTDETTTDKKKKKKGKTEKKEEDPDKGKKKKGPNAALVAAMQEQLLKKKEEEERLRQLEEERFQQEEEMDRLRLERIRIEAEKKEKKKQKEKERKQRLKDEGKLLSAKQKLDQSRAQAMLENLRAQGIELPEVGEKRPRPGTRIRPKKKDQVEVNQTKESSNGVEVKDDISLTQDEVKVEEVPVKVEEVIKDSWDASSSEDESKEDPAPVASKTSAAATKPTTTQVSVEKSDSQEESNSEEDEDDSSDEDDSDESDNQDNKKSDAQIKREKAWQRIQKRRHAAEQKRTVDNLRAAVVCVLGHVDTGKTKILDKLRRTNVQDGEAGGITQQIGATNVPIENIKEQCRIVKGASEMVYKLPGLLIIDTPGHESFSNLRNRGSSLCDIAILVVDIMHGLEPQTIESINLLKSRKTPFVVALNKIDRLYDWNTTTRKDVRDILKAQEVNTQREFEKRSKEVILQFAEQGLNAALFYENPDPRTYVNLVPTSAITGEGMGNLLHLIVESCQSWLAKRLMYSEELLAIVLEVKALSGLGTTIDAILINGKLREGDTMIIAGTDGPITTQIRSLLMPQPMKELRVKNAYIEYKEIIAAQGVKIAAKELEKAIAGLNLYVANNSDEIDFCRDEVAKELRNALSHIKLSNEGVYVQASTLGSLEALLEFLRTSKIPYANIRIGPVVKRDVMKASIMLEHESTYATILAFDVKVERDARELADSLGVKIFEADIIYHLFDKFMAYREEIKAKKRDEFRSIAVFPCKMKILPQFIFNSRDPIVMGVMVENGIVKEGTPICVPSKEFLDVGIITSIEYNHKQVETARKGQEVCIKIESIPGESPKMFGRHFDETDMLVSKISRESIDACKNYFRDDLIKADWSLMVELKKLFQIL